MTMEAPPLCQSRDTGGGRYSLLHVFTHLRLYCQLWCDFLGYGIMLSCRQWQTFWMIHFLHLRWRLRQEIHLKYWHPATGLHGVISQRPQSKCSLPWKPQVSIIVVTSRKIRFSNWKHLIKIIVIVVNSITGTVLGRWLSLLFCTWEIPGSNISPQKLAVMADIFHGFFCSFLSKWWNNTWKETAVAAFCILSRWLFKSSHYLMLFNLCSWKSIVM